MSEPSSEAWNLRECSLPAPSVAESPQVVSSRLSATFLDLRFLRWASLVSRPSSRAPCQNHALNTDEDLVCTQCLLCNRQLVDGILCLRPRSVRPARGPPTPPARAAAKTRTALTAQTSAAARAAFAAQAVATARAAAKVEPIGLSNSHSNGSPLMAWGWETANICQSKLSWVLLGFGEWKADKASPH